ncbi:MAG TPA: hypothetical protein VGR45_15265, partial [Stellaceae bacterium]|nr:hypothetical protein [Stellaceae bacterium]
SGYDEFAIGVLAGNSGLPSASTILARRGSNQPFLFSSFPLSCTPRQFFCVRVRMPVTRMSRKEQSPLPEFYHEYDCGILMALTEEIQMLFMAHKAEPFIIEATTNIDIIQRELCNYFLVEARRMGCAVRNPSPLPLSTCSTSGANQGRF